MKKPVCACSPAISVSLLVVSLALKTCPHAEAQRQAVSLIRADRLPSAPVASPQSRILSTSVLAGLRRGFFALVRSPSLGGLSQE
jgi:hypothetical protein